MEIRFNTTNDKVEKVLETINKSNRKFFVEEAIVHYLNFLEQDRFATSLFVDIHKLNEELEKPQEQELQEGQEYIEDENDIDNNDEFAIGW